MADAVELIKLKLVHEIHTSERKSYRACRRRWDWIFRDSLYPFMTAKPLEFGTAFHLGMETYYDPKMWNAPRATMAEYAVTKFVEKCESQRKAFLEQSAVPYLEADVKEDYDERVELGKGMLRHYFQNIAPGIDVGWKPIKVEVAFMVPIPHPKTGEQVIWCKCDQCWNRFLKYAKQVYDETGQDDHPPRAYWQGLPVVYAGRCDMVAEDKEGNWWIFDWKSARAVNVDHDEFLELDDQVASYVWALTKLGFPIRGFVYHEQKKGYPQPPKQNKVRRLGCMFSVSKNQDTDYETYLATVKEYDTEAYESGCYDEMLEYLRNEGIIFFKRWQILKTQYQNSQTEYNIGLEALEMIDPDIPIYPSPGRFGCTTCAFRQPCLEVNTGGDVDYWLKELFEQREHYYVRAEPSTESKGGE